MTKNGEVERRDGEEGWMAVGGRGTGGSEGTERGERATGQTENE